MRIHWQWTYKLFTFAIFLFCIVLFSACNPTKNLKNNELLVNRVKVKTDTRKVSNDELLAIVKQKPNRRILGLFRFHLTIYNLYKKESDDILRKTVGEPPVIYDSLLTNKTEQQLYLLMKNRGFFEAEVQTVKKNRKKKVNLTYRIRSKQAYIVQNIKIDCADKNIKDIIDYSVDEIKQLEKQNFNTDKLNKLRETISKNIRNNGYYFFSKDYINYTADTVNKEYAVDITLHILPFREKQKTISNTDSTVFSLHKNYKIGNIYIRQDFEPSVPNLAGDTLIDRGGIYFIQNGKPRFKPAILSYTLLLNKDGFYSQTDHELSYKRFNSLKVFKYTNIQITKSPTTSSENLLDCYVYLSPLLTRSFSLEAEGTNTGGNLGIAGNISYQNRNTFRGAELLNIKLKGGIEAQPLIIRSTENSEIINNLPFNTIEFGPEITFEVPKFLMPIRIDKFSKRANPKTIFQTSYNFQQRPDYNRSVFQTDFGYYWNESDFKKHIISPIDLSLVKLNPSPTFKQLLDSINDPFLLNSYRDHLILAVKYSYIFNNQSKPKQLHYYYFRFNFETAGNVLNTVSKVMDFPLDELGSFEFFGIRFSQYVRSNIDFRYYIKQKNATTAFRVATGAGLPYGNVNALPFEKGFYGGGANGMRAWRVRTLGPGSLSDSLISSRIDQIGEMHLEGNIEYRFDISKLFKGAFFIDAGNIWMLNKNQNRPNAEFNISRFWRDIALGTGFGMRLDFGYFLLRFDLGIPLKIPSSENPYLIKPRFNAPPLNLGIGYPF
ncbi:hypothetical protein FLAV_01825 [Flavobacteriales bacterium]|nr:hypothetical protein [Bacteroidota bacterium]MBV6462479.1 Outer membrane protein assembly factor BamA [Flavobacteriales bacterium]WKZ74355.1 MAG: BamA/TamA family outer membrane protein [Vicingaceae bacterium]CAG0982117.1 hypothetical protein FLAV_01825 [Flavobacteriales bacterium]